MIVPRMLSVMGLVAAIAMGAGCEREEEPVTVPPAPPAPAAPETAPVEKQPSLLDRAGEVADDTLSVVKEPVKETVDALTPPAEDSDTAREAAAQGAADAADGDDDADADLDGMNLDIADDGADADAADPAVSDATWLASATAQLNRYRDSLPGLRDAAGKLNNPELTTIVSNLDELIAQATDQLNQAKAAAMGGDISAARAKLQPMLDQIKPLFDRAMALAQAAAADNVPLMDMMK